MSDTENTKVPLSALHGALLQLLCPLVDNYVITAVQEGLLDSQESGAFVMNVILNLFNSLIKNAWEHNTPKGIIAAYMKDSFIMLSTHVLLKIGELPDDGAPETPEENQNPSERVH